MSNDTLVNETNTEVTETSTTTQEKTYTQDEFNKHMAGLKRKYEKQYEELGSVEELRQLKIQAEQAKQDQALKRGQFDEVLKEFASKKDAEIAKRDNIIREYKVTTPLVNAAAKYRAVNADQVRSLLVNSVRLNQDGEVEVVDDKGTVRYADNGAQYSVEDLVKEFLDKNTHFVQPTPATTMTKSNVSNNASQEVDITKLNMSNPKDRETYKQYRKANGLA